jgi:two-component SAPR family response regulator
MEEAKKHVVSIDDEANILALVQVVLQDDYQVTTFNNTDKALEAIPVIGPDLIICDINMPGRDGFEIHQHLRTLPEARSIPFIYLTGLMDRENFRRGMNLGADDYLTKPFSPDELKEAVKTRLLRIHNLREDDWEITSLGGVALTAKGQVLEYEAKKVIELLLYLITKGRTVIWRDLFKDLWFDVVNDNSVHVLVGRARKTFDGLAEFIIDGDKLSLNLSKPYVWDAQVFEAAAKTALESKHSGHTEKAIGMYKGPFLTSFESPWSSNQRDYYEGLYIRLLESSIEIAPGESERQLARKRLDSFWESA